METTAAPSAPATSAAPSPSAAPAPSPASPAPATTPAPATAAGTTPAPTPAQTAAAKRYKARINGEDREIEADIVDRYAQAFGLDPREALKAAQMNVSAYQRWQEAAKLRKEVEEREAASKKRYEDPRVAEIKARNPGMDDEDAYALARVIQLKEREEMSPELRALQDERSKREALERQMKDREEQGKKTELEQSTKAEAVKLDREITEAFTKHQMPRVPAVARAVLDHMAAMARAGEVPDVEAATLFVKRRVQSDDVSRLGAMSDEQIEAWLGKPLIDRILKRSIEKVRGPQGNGAPPPTPKPTNPPERKTLTEEEWRAKYR